MYEHFKGVRIDKQGAELRVTLDNPPMNAATPQMHNELARIFSDINHDPDCGVVVLTGAGDKAFSAGGDINNMVRRLDTADHAGWTRSVTEARHIVNGLLDAAAYGKATEG